MIDAKSKKYISWVSWDEIAESWKSSYTISSTLNFLLITKSQFHFLEMALDWESGDMESISGLPLIRYVILGESFNLLESWLPLL